MKFKVICILLFVNLLGFLKSYGQELVGSTTVIWSTLPHKKMDYRDELYINSPLFNNFKANITKDRIVIGERGATFHTDMTEDVASYPEWVQIRAELREAPLSSVVYGNTQIYEFEFEVDELPYLAGGVTIFQRFKKSIDDPDFSFVLKGDGQWPGDPNLQNRSIVIKPFDLPWVKTYTLLKEKNHLIVAIYTHEDGYYKASLNGQTLGEGSANTTTDTVTYSGPQFGVYNHGNTIEKIALTHTKYVYTEYKDAIDFESITTQDPNIFLSTEDFEAAPESFFYPNPVNNYLYVYDNVSMFGKEIKVFDVSGKLIFKDIIASSKLDVSNLKKGFYIVEVDNYIVKFIKD